MILTKLRAFGCSNCNKECRMLVLTHPRTS